jgi:hypothetical protein
MIFGINGILGENTKIILQKIHPQRTGFIQYRAVAGANTRSILIQGNRLSTSFSLSSTPLEIQVFPFRRVKYKDPHTRFRFSLRNTSCTPCDFPFSAECYILLPRGRDPVWYNDLARIQTTTILCADDSVGNHGRA